MPAHILIVEDDPVTRSILTSFLGDAGYTLSEAEDAEQFRTLFDPKKIDLVLLDINLPGDDGLTLTKEIRSQARTGIIILSARQEDIDRLLGLELGADDYLTKPFLERELLLRIKNLLDRIHSSPPHEEENYQRLEFFGWTLDMETRGLYSPEGEYISLSTGEYHLLLTLVRHPGRVYSREQLIRKVSNREWMPSDRTIDVMVGRLRKKIEKNPKKPAILQMVYGVGYRLAHPDMA